MYAFKLNQIVFPIASLLLSFSAGLPCLDNPMNMTQTAISTKPPTVPTTFGTNAPSSTETPSVDGRQLPSSLAANTSQVVVNDGTWLEASTTRYWDCCKPSCAWPGKGLSNPIKTVQRDLTTPANPDDKSGCEPDGTSFASFQQTPFTNNNEFFGYAAVHLSGKTEADWCGQCYALEFTDGPVAGKRMTVLVTNTGGDLNDKSKFKENHFDLAMPGGGVGIFPEGCKKLFPGFDLGGGLGGVQNVADCAKLPVPMQAGCLWRFNDFMGADNPDVRFKQVTCPEILTKTV
jgi:hypothetical protein